MIAHAGHQAEALYDTPPTSTFAGALMGVGLRIGVGLWLVVVLGALFH